MYYIGIDLGTTNLKAAAYDSQFRCIGAETEPVTYEKEGDRVEFDAEEYFVSLTRVISRLLSSGKFSAEEIRSIGLTGQAETLVVLDGMGRPLMNAISWMDERSREECGKIAECFSPEEIEAVTGQMAVLPTWPATKILWLKNNQRDIFENAATYMLLKDYITFRLTGRMLADCSIATFSFYFDIYNRCYWQKMLDVIGISAAQLPPLAEPCSQAGSLTPEAALLCGLRESVAVNVGTLDHFAGMIGTGNIQEGSVSLSTGTVMALAALAKRPENGNYGIAMHYGFRPGTYVMLPVAESGGVCLEWFRSVCMPGISYGEMNEVLESRKLPGPVLFLPYLVGTNAPEFDEKACGLFYGLRGGCDIFDMAGAVMEGVAFLLRKNCESIVKAGMGLTGIIATGGGAKSPVWCQMQADITGLPVMVPRETEATCLGAAIAGAAGVGDFGSVEEACRLANGIEKRYEPHPDPLYERKYRQFCFLYQAMTEAARME